jgi:hypothetical protein
VESAEYMKVMAAWKASSDVLEYDEKLRKWQALMKQKDIEERIKRCVTYFLLLP